MGIFDEIKKKIGLGKRIPYRSMNDSGFTFLSSDIATPFITFADGTDIRGTKPIVPSDLRESMKPAEVWELLKNDTAPVVDCAELDEKIKIVEKRLKVLSDHVPDHDLNAEHMSLGYLKARKKYAQFKHLFAYPTTTDAMVADLCRTYKLKVTTVAKYSGTMPAEAIDELERYKKACLRIRKDIPNCKLIVPDNDPKTEKKARDPILLCSSPFGNWDYIIGAWDKEVLVVDELIYMGK